MHQSAASKLTMGSVVIGAFNAVTPKLEEQLQIITTTSLKGISVMTNTVLKYGSILFLCAVALLNQQLKFFFFYLFIYLFSTQRKTQFRNPFFSRVSWPRKATANINQTVHCDKSGTEIFWVTLDRHPAMFQVTP